MDKFLDLNTYKIKSVNNNTVILEEYIDANILNAPLKSMQEILKQIVSKRAESVFGKTVFYIFYVTGNCTTEDVHDIYDYVENALTDVFCSPRNLTEDEILIQKQREERLGLYGMPKTNLKNADYLRWVKSVPLIKGIGFKVQTLNGSWSRRMIK